MTHDDRKDALRAEVEEIDARLQQIAASDRELTRLHDDPEVRSRLDAYAKEFGDGDPTWWKPEFELSEAVASERREQVVATAPRPLLELTGAISKLVISGSAEQRERLSRETGIAIADLKALEGADLQRRSRVALQIAEQIHAVRNVCGKYGLEPGEFEQLEPGPADRSVGTLVGRSRRPAPKPYRMAASGITGTAKLDVPSEVEEIKAAERARQDDTARISPPASSNGEIPGVRRDGRRLFLGLAAAMVVGGAIFASQRGSCSGGAEPRQPVVAATTGAAAPAIGAPPEQPSAAAPAPSGAASSALAAGSSTPSARPSSAPSARPSSAPSAAPSAGPTSPATARPSVPRPSVPPTTAAPPPVKPTASSAPPAPPTPPPPVTTISPPDERPPIPLE